MSLIVVVIILIALAVLVGLEEKYLALTPPWPTLIRWVALVGAVIWLINLSGILQYASQVPFPKVGN